MANTHAKTGSATSATTTLEDDSGTEMQKQLSEAFDELDGVYKDLVELRKPVKKKEAEINTIYNALEKGGYDRKAAKFLYDQHRMKKKFTPEFRITVNAYYKATGGQGDLFDTSSLQRQ